MSKITLDVNDKNVQTVLLILESLKDGLISNIDVDKRSLKYKTAYKPKVNKVIYKNEQMTQKLDGKYLNATSFKNRLKK